MCRPRGALMRITNNIIQRNALAALQANARGMASAQQRVSTGIRVERASDDPAASSATADAGARAAALTEVEQLYQHAIQIANTQLGGRYIFGGATADVAPFDTAGTPTVGTDPTAGSPTVQIGRTLTIRTNHAASEVFTDSGVLQSLDDLRTALGGSDLDAIAQAGDAVRDGSQAVQNLLGEIGVWSNQLDVTTANLDAVEMNLKTLKSDLQEVDFEEAMVDLISRQTSYQAAMMATSRVMGMTLADYLR